MPPEHYQTKGFKALYAMLQGFCMQHDISFTTCPCDALYTLCDADGRVSKKLVMQQLAERYPELQPYYAKEVRNKNKYYVKLFEAVGVGTLHEQAG